MAEPGLSGRCLCGAIRWRATAQPLWAAHCHCESCRRATSSPFTSYIGYATEAVDWTGTPATFASSPGVTRGFCPTCGSPLFFRSERWPDETHVFAASLYDPSLYRPEGHAYWEEHLPWADINDGLPRS